MPPIAIDIVPPRPDLAWGDPGHFRDRLDWRVVAVAIWLVLVCTAAVPALALAGGGQVGRLVSAQGFHVIRMQFLGLALLAPAAVMVVAAGGLDLSVGAVAALAGVICASTLEHYSFANAAAIALLVAAGIGIIHALAVGALRLPGAAVTLATMATLGGGTLILTDGKLVVAGDALPPLEGMQVPLIAALAALAVLAIVLMQFTPVGRRPARDEAAPGEGPVARCIYDGLPYVLSSLSAALAGLWWLARIRTGDAMAGRGTEVEILLAVTLGGTCIGLRFGTVVGALVGVLLVVVARTVLNLAAIEPWFGTAGQGAALLAFLVILRLYYALVNLIYRHTRRPRPIV